MSFAKDFIDNLNIHNGVMTYNDFNIDENRSFKAQEFSYKEDILQITFGERYTLDVGWYPEGNPDGYFLVKGIEDCDWMRPLIMIRSRSLGELKGAIEQVAMLLSSQKKAFLEGRLPVRDYLKAFRAGSLSLNAMTTSLRERPATEPLIVDRYHTWEIFERYSEHVLTWQQLRDWAQAVLHSGFFIVQPEHRDFLQQIIEPWTKLQSALPKSKVSETLQIFQKVVGSHD